MAEECWSTGDDVDDHVVCTANIQRLGPSEETRTKDDLDCLYIDDLFVPTAAPTLAPTLSPVLSFNCTTYDTRVQVLQVDDDSDMYGVASLEATTGEYDILWDVDWFDGHVNAVGLYAPEGEGTYAWGSFGGCLCKFYRVRAQRLDAPLEEEKPNVDAVLGGGDDYSKDVSRDERRFYWVESILDDEPVSRSGVEFLVSEDLYEEAVLDVATVTETGGQVWIDDDLVDGSYLFRLGEAFEIFVGKIITDGGCPEVAKFQDADRAVPSSGSGAGLLHALNPVRVGYITDRVDVAGDAARGGAVDASPLDTTTAFLLTLDDTAVEDYDVDHRDGTAAFRAY
ncbi:hypothetical protein SO694_0024702 [Aureococcus anophagefferens]|uniref:Uncharacterized protein n=1 Tax=Aureococcus anophagefferens TaxID=44056 RepID=A0ABR1FRR7_AURAN